MTSLYATEFGLLTDLYQLTMASGYWSSGMAEREAVFHLFFRKLPFGGGYAIACGTQSAFELLESLRFSPSDLEYLSTLTGHDDRPLFDPAFIEALGEIEWRCDIEALPEGTAVFPNEPIVRVTGPLLQCQLLETLLLNVINFQTLIATKSARICEAARGEPVLEFGLRRAQGIDGGLSASRAAFVGGAAATSNLLAGKTFGIPVKGTHAHSWVMAFDSELEAFATYADALPNNVIFLVDTYDTIEGVRNAITIGRRLRERGHDLLGIRLDSGDLADLSIRTRAMLDEAGFEESVIVASNDLDEQTIESLKHQGAKIAVWGVGTNLVTGSDQPALGGVYKLAAIRDDAGEWQPRVKLSEQRIKTSIPGCLQVRRFTEGEQFAGDIIYDEFSELPNEWSGVDPLNPARIWNTPPETTSEPLLQPMFQRGRPVWEQQSLNAAQQRTRDQLARLPVTIKRLLNPHEYRVGLEAGLDAKRTRLIEEARGDVNS